VEVLVLFYGGYNIVEGVFITFSCLLDIFHSVLKSLPLDARSKQFVLSKNVVAFLTKKTQFPLYL